MAHQLVFTKEVQNAVRLALLLIEEGTPTLRGIFDDEISKKFGSLREGLRKKQEIVKSYLTGNKKKGIPQIITCIQYKKLYPNHRPPTNDSSCFDITLFTALLNIVCDLPPPSTGNWSHDPHPGDKSMAANIIRLRKARNTIYGHITNMKLSNSEFEQKWKDLSDILQHLGADIFRINSWKEAPIQPDAVDYVRKELRMLIEQDVADVQAIAERVIEVTRSVGQNITQTFSQELEDIRNYVNQSKEYDDFFAATLFQLIEKVEESCGQTDLMQKLITLRTENQLKELQSIKVIIMKSGKTQSDTLQKIQEGQSSLEAGIEAILSQNEKMQASCSSMVSVDMQRKLTEVRSLYINSNSSFKVLIFNEPKTREHLRDLATALGYVPWDIVLDLDYNSLVSGMYDILTGVLGKHKNIHAVTYREAEKLSDEDLDAVAHGKKCLWIQANGCVVKECEPSLEKFAKAKFNISKVLTDTMKKMPSQKFVLCTSLLLGNAAQKQIKLITTAVVDACEIAEDVIEQMPHFITLSCIEYGFEENRLPIMTDNDDEKSVVAPEHQIAHMFLEIYHRDIEQRYVYPGNHGNCFMSSEAMTQLMPLMDLYHFDIGKLDDKDMNAEEISEKVASIRDGYQKGSTITHEALYLQASGREKIYVKRKIMIEFETSIREELESRKTKRDSRYMALYVVDHDACGGATTCLRHLLFSLKNQYPCIELKHLEQQTFDILKTISTHSQLPLLIVAEGSTFTTSDIQSLVKRLSNDWIQGILIHSKRIIKGKAPPSSDNVHFVTKRVYITSNIQDDENELSAFRDLYDQGQSNKRANRIFLFGILAFLNAYQKCEEHIKTCVENIDNISASILRIVCFVWKYAHIGVKTRLLLKYFKSESKKNGVAVKGRKSIEHYLGYANDILVVACEDQEPLLRPAVDFVVEPTLEKLNPTGEGDRIKRFLDDFEKLTEADGEEQVDSRLLLMVTFILRDKEAGLDWSQFVTDIERIEGKEYVESVLQKFSEITKHTKFGAHYRTLYARYLMLRMNKPEEAICQIKQAIGVKNGDSIRNCSNTENQLLSAYGNLHRLRVTKCFKSNILSKGVEYALLMAQEDTQEAIFAFEKAQKSTWNAIQQRRDQHIPAPFWMEANARYTLLSLYLEHKCKKNLTNFRKYIQRSGNELLQESEDKGQEALDKLELLIKLDKVNDVNPGFTFQRLLEAKFQFLRLGVDSKTAEKVDKGPNHLRGAISKMPDSVAFDIGTLVMLDFSTGKPKLWSDLDHSDLQFIIKQIDRRIANARMLAKNYLDIITAMIFIRHLGYASATEGIQGYNIDYALQCATIWVDKYPEDFDAHFILGVLKTIRGLETFDLTKIVDGQAALRMCKTICDKRKSTKNYRAIRFSIGKGSGLEKVLPSNLSNPGAHGVDVATGKLETFTGRLVNEKDVKVRHGSLEKAFTANVPQWEKNRSKEVVALSKRMPLVDFNCAFSQDKILAFNITLHESHSSESDESEEEK